MIWIKSTKTHSMANSNKVRRSDLVELQKTIGHCNHCCQHYHNIIDGQAVLCSYSKTGFWTSYCQISTNLDKILHTPVVVHLWADLDRDRRVGGSRPNQNDYVFVILVTHPKSYIEMTDHRNFGSKPSKWWGWVLSWKIPEFFSVGGDQKTASFAFLWYPSTILRTVYRKVLPQTKGTDGKPTLWRCAFC